MKTMQQRITDIVEQAVREAGHELIQAGQTASNVGKWTAPQKGDVFAQNGRVLNYDFQSGYVVFKTSPQARIICSIQYTEPGSANTGLAKVIDYLLATNK
jgi:hypothetical protein